MLIVMGVVFSGEPCLWSNFHTPDKPCASSSTNRGRRSLKPTFKSYTPQNGNVEFLTDLKDVQLGDHDLEDILLLEEDVCLTIEYLVLQFLTVPMSQDGPMNKVFLGSGSVLLVEVALHLHQFFIFLLNQCPLFSTIKFGSLDLWVLILFLDGV